jgi:DNA-binding NarL/FixJ family response regulator
MINLLIADDHQLLIDGITTTLEDVRGIRISAIAKNGREVLEILDENKDIDIILMDINMPEMDGLECTKLVKKKYPEIEVIALSQYAERRFIKQMLKFGAKGYLLKDSTKAELVNAIKEVKKGGQYLSKRMTQNFIKGSSSSIEAGRLFTQLSKREKDILKLLCNGMSSQEISKELSISFHTVQTHRSNLFLKTGSKNIANLVKWAIENELLE